MNLTPHGPGFSFLDSFTVTVGGREGIGRVWLDPAFPFFADHFPGQPLMPGVLLIECAAQAGGALLASVLAPNERLQFALAQVAQFKLQHAVHPGETVETHVVLDKIFARLAQFDVSLQVEGTEVARGRLVLSRPEA